MAAVEFSTGSVRDQKEIKDTLYSISERLKYYFKALSLEDNFEPEMYLSLHQNNEKASALQIAEKGLRSDYADLEEQISSRMALIEEGIELAVDKGDVTNQLNLEPDTLKISGNRLIVSGYYFNLDEDNNLTVRGNVTAKSGQIAGWSITKDGSRTVMYGGSSAKLKANTYNCSQDIYLNNLYVTGYSGTNLSNCLMQCAGATIDIYNARWLNTMTFGSVNVYGDIRCGNVVGENRTRTNTFIAENRVVTRKGGSYTSDERLKKDIETISESDADRLLQDIRPVTFRWLDGGEASVGFIAQEAAEIENKLELDYGMTKTDSNGYMGLNYTDICILLLKKLQQQTKEIDELTA